MGLRLATGRNLAFSPTRLFAILVLLTVWAAAQPSLGQVGDPATGGPRRRFGEPGDVRRQRRVGRFSASASNIKREATAKRPAWAALGINRSWLFDRIVFFADGSARIDDDHLRPPTPSFGGGLRFLYQNWLSGDSERIFGANFWYDGTHTTGLDPNGQLLLFPAVGRRTGIPGRAVGFPRQREFSHRQHGVCGAVNNHHRSSTSIFSRPKFAQFKRYAVTDGRGRGRPPHRRQEPLGFCKLLRPRRRRRTSGRRKGRPPRILGPRRAGQPVGRQRRHVRHHGDVQHYVVPRLGAHGRAEMAPACLTDRFREPVQRNDYVAVCDQAASRHRSRHRRLRNALVLCSRQQQRGRGRRRNLRASLHHPDAGPEPTPRPETTSSCTETACSAASPSR